MITFVIKLFFYRNIVRLPSMVEGPQDTSLQRTGGINGAATLCGVLLNIS